MVSLLLGDASYFELDFNMFLSSFQRTLELQTAFADFIISLSAFLEPPADECANLGVSVTVCGECHLVTVGNMSMRAVSVSQFP